MKYILLAIAFILFSCKESDKVSFKPVQVLQEPESRNTYDPRTVYIYTIDSCEYIGSLYGAYGDVLTHKGNCKFCVQRNKK